MNCSLNHKDMLAGDVAVGVHSCYATPVSVINPGSGITSNESRSSTDEKHVENCTEAKCASEVSI